MERKVFEEIKPMFEGLVSTLKQMQKTWVGKSIEDAESVFHFTCLEVIKGDDDGCDTDIYRESICTDKGNVSIVISIETTKNEKTIMGIDLSCVDFVYYGHLYDCKNIE